jgi:DNA invertase Pin-like site-specific DNA recombinase
MQIDPEARRAAIKLMRQGVITTAEAARLAGVSRQVVYAWCKRARIVRDQSRHARITKAWRKAISARD